MYNSNDMGLFYKRDISNDKRGTWKDRLISPHGLSLDSLPPPALVCICNDQLSSEVFCVHCTSKVVRLHLFVTENLLHISIPQRYII